MDFDSFKEVVLKECPEAVVGYDSVEDAYHVEVDDNCHWFPEAVVHETSAGDMAKALAIVCRRKPYAGLEAWVPSQPPTGGPYFGLDRSKGLRPARPPTWRDRLPRWVRRFASWLLLTT